MANKDWLHKGMDGLSFGERLGDLISDNKTTANAVAKDTGITQSAISNYLNTDRAPDCATIIALSKHFSVSTNYLLGLTDVKTPVTDIQAVVAQTGLTESNVQTLQYFSNNAIFTQLYNDGIELLSDLDITVSYAAMLSALKVPAYTSPSDLESIAHEWSEEDALRQKGCVKLTGEEAFYFYCTRVAEDFKKALIEKYLPSAEWRKENGNH